MTPRTDPRRLAEAISALGTSCPADGSSPKDVPVLLGTLLAAVEGALMESGNGGPGSVAAVLHGYEAASSLVHKVGWETALLDDGVGVLCFVEEPEVGGDLRVRE
ncbi:hypothetical protein ACWC9R_11835 [Streptomyces sp. NPDC001219]